MNDLVKNFTNITEISHIYHPSEIIVNLVISFILGIIISLVYKKTHKGLSYSQSFLVTNIFVCVIVCMVIMIIGNSLARAFALVGLREPVDVKSPENLFMEVPILPSQSIKKVFTPVSYLIK